jgi:CHAT domain-containing protein
VIERIEALSGVASRRRLAATVFRVAVALAVGLLLGWRRGHERDNAVAALMAFGKSEAAQKLLLGELQESTGEVDVAAAIHRSQNATLLNDFSAVALHRFVERHDASELLLSFEAADCAWRLVQTPRIAWNRALAAENLGLPVLAARAWQAAAETSPPRAREANERKEEARRRAGAPQTSSVEAFFQSELIEQAMATVTGTHATSADTAGELGRRIEVAAGDQLAPDTLASLADIRDHGSVADRRRAAAALTSYARGRVAFENDRLEDARAAFASAESDLAALHVPLALLVRDQRIRAECSQAKASCMPSIRAFRAELEASGRYPWLEARAAYAEGQTLYRRGRIYDAAEWLQRAQSAFHRLNDAASEGVMHSLLANVFTAAGETDLALAHYIEAIRIRAPQMGDRRHRQLEDAVAFFMLRHGFLSTAEALLDEMKTVPTTDSGRVMESALRGILHARRRDARKAAVSFERAHTLLETVSDEALRSEVGMVVAIAEAGSRSDSPNAIVEQIDAAIAKHQDVDQAIWLPQLLTDRGNALEQRNELVRAEHDYLQAMQLLEQRSPRIDQMLIGLGAGSQSESPFDHAIRLFLRQGRITDALTVAQRSTTLRISSLYAPAVGLRDVFRAAREPASADSAAEMRRALQPDQAAIAYHLLQDELVTWVITRKEVFAVRRSVRAQEFIRRVDGLRECAAAGRCERNAIESGSNLLLRDWIEHVPREATLLIQPPAELQAVPFCMLRTGGQEPLLARNPITTAPSLAALVRATHFDEQRATATGAFFAAAGQPGGGHEPLPLAVSEVRRASRAYAEPAVDTHASRAQFMQRSRFYAIVHFAGHIVVNDEQPLLSALVFDSTSDAADSTLLYVHELDEQSFAQARLIVLSGCDSGRSPRPTMSVAHALLSQKVPSVVYTLWPVSDKAAEAFAIAFHRAIANGQSRAGAVREAQQSLLAKKTDATEAWAAFALAGIPSPLVFHGKIATRVPLS